MGNALVLNAHAKHGLETIRRLGERDVDVTAGSTFRVNAGRLSRYSDRSFTYPAPDDEPAAFVDAVERELAGGDYDVLVPINETTVSTVVEHRSRFDHHAAVPFPPLELLRVGTNKRRTVEAAREAGIPHPQTRFSKDTDLDAVDDALEYPVVVKPEHGSGGSGVSVCESYDDLVETARDTIEAHGPVLFQEFVPNGGERGVYTLYDHDSTPVGRTVQRRIRTRSPDGGASTYRETVEDPDLVERTDELLSAIEWEGLAMAEYRIDPRTGEPKLLELNPRFWGSLALSTYAGVDFPYLLYQLAVGEDPEPSLDYEVGVRARCLFTDGLQVFARDDRLVACYEFVQPSREPCRYDIVSSRDPLSVLGQVGYWGSTLLQ